MGISANYIQANNINSHTIVENHPQIIEKLKTWAQNKPNVNIIEGDWYDVKDSLSTYDGIFYDTWGEEDWSRFATVLPLLSKSISTVVFDVGYDVINVNPPSNCYFNSNMYYLPKKEF